MGNRREHRGRLWLVCVLAVSLCLGVMTFAAGCDAESLGGAVGSDGTVDPNEMTGQKEALPDVPGSSADDPIPTVPGERLLEGIYYSCDIDGTEGEEVFCYLGSQMNTGYPQFEVNGLTMTLASCALEEPVAQVIETEDAETEDSVKERREVYYLTDIREGDGQREFALLDQGAAVANYTIFCRYERSMMHWIANVEGFPFAQEHEENCGAGELVGIDGQGHVVSTFALDLAQLWTAAQTWELTAGGSLVEVEPEDGWYEGLTGVCRIDEGGIEYPNPARGRVYAPYLGQDLEVFTEPDRNAEIVVWEKGDDKDGQSNRKVTLTHTDNEHWIRLELMNGESGWIYLETPEVLVQEDGLTYMDYALYDLKPLTWKYGDLSWGEIQQVLAEQALQKEPITVEVKREGTQLSSGVLYQADLDDDGEMEQFCYVGALLRENLRPLFLIDGKEYEVGDGYQPVISWGARNYLGGFYEEYYLCDIQPGDGQMEFALGDESDDSGCHETDWLAFDGTWMRYIGTMDGFPFTQREEGSEWTYKIRNGIWGLDGQGHVGTYMKLDILDKLWADVVWELNPTTGMLEPIEPEDGLYVNNQSRYIPFQGDYSGDNWSVYYLRMSMPLYREPDLEADSFVMEVQAPGYREQVYLTHTDGEHWGRIENQDGEAGWFYLDGGKLVLPEEGEASFAHYIHQVFEYKIWDGEAASDTDSNVGIGIAQDEKYPFLLDDPQEVTLTGTEMQLMSGVLYSADLDGDGDAEEFAYCGLESGGNASGYLGGGETLYPTFIIDGQRVQSGYFQSDGYTENMKNEWGNVLEGLRFYLCDIRRGDGQWELAVLDPGPSNDPVTTFLRWDGERLRLVGRVADFPFAQENSCRQEEYADGTYGLDGRGNVKIRARGDILQTWWIRETWRLDQGTGQLELVVPEDGLFENANPYDYSDYTWQGNNDYKGMYPHLLQDLPLYRQRDLDSETFVMAADTHGVDNKIYFTHTDNEHWVRVEDDAGEVGWFYLDHVIWLVTEDGKEDIDQYIGGLNTAD